MEILNDVLNQFGSTKYFGECEKFTKGNQGILLNLKSEQVTLDDRFNIISWFRVLDDSPEIGSDHGFGFNHGMQPSKRIKWLIAYKKNLGNSIKDIIYKLSEDQINYRNFSIDLDFKINPDHESVYNSEFKDDSYEKHRMTWRLFSVEFKIMLYECEC